MVNATPQATTGQQDGRTVLLQLLAEVARGNKSAFARLYGLTHAKLLGVGLRILRDRALAEDVLQESYLKVWRHAASYDPSIASPMTWMATIVRHGAIDALRKRQIEAFAGDDEVLAAVPSNDPDPVEEMHLARLRPKALAAFARLPEDKRRLIMLAYLQGPQPPRLVRPAGYSRQHRQDPPAARATGAARHDVCVDRKRGSARWPDSLYETIAASAPARARTGNSR